MGKVAPAESSKSLRKGTQRREGRRWRLYVLILRYIRAVVFLLNVRTLFMVGIACLMVYLCESQTLDLQ